MTDELTEEFEHQQFLDYLHQLEEKLFLALWNASLTDIQNVRYDIAKFGTEPAFASLVFDKLLEEQNNESR